MCHGIGKDERSKAGIVLEHRKDTPPIGWFNVSWLAFIHVSTFVGLYYFPLWSINKATVLLWLLQWQVSNLGITIGYHRLFTHRAFRASLGVRVVLAILGAAAFQRSIIWWALRHRLHHRYTDHPVHDPYAATRGMFFAHLGWMFFDPEYERMDLVEKEDLESDPVVRYQDKYYVPIAISFGLGLPTLIGWLWGDALSAFIWGGLFSKFCVMHGTFLVNSLAHWRGLQPYSDENSSRGNLFVALMTVGEGNHNFHAFPFDYRAGTSITDYDPSKWIILVLHKLGLVTGLRRARPGDMVDALEYMRKKEVGKLEPEEDSWKGETWSTQKVRSWATEKSGRCVLLIDGYAVDATAYLREHPGGATLLRRYAVGTKKEEEAEWAFNGGLNNHERAARRTMRKLRVAKVVD
ncbi:hypothetical protein BJ165DRAFT_1339358 [Panaeolus papilionaceus]|nr:hypothetical protein BJ165DRAFT_1339358 [Panaeolus papilionaceus]